MIFPFYDDQWDTFGRDHDSRFNPPWLYSPSETAHIPRRRIFYSFHFQKDAWRAAQVRNMNLTEHDAPLSNNDWEQLRRGGDAAIKTWINRQMYGKSCLVVLIGTHTSKRRWVEYEISKAWNDGKGVLGIYIHNLRNREGLQERQGANPFASLTLGYNRYLSEIVPVYNPKGFDSKDVYAAIRRSMVSWVENAIRLRKQFD